MKNHLKRIATPSTWELNRKENIFTVRPNSGAHGFEVGLPLGVIIRDMLDLALTMNEAKKLLNNNTILVDGKRRKDHRFIVGLFDVLSFSELKKYYRMTLNKKGKIVAIEISEKESTIKPCKIVGKTILQKGRIQYNLHDGKNIISDKSAKVGDSFILTLPNLEINQVLPLKTGLTVFLMKGKNKGSVGLLKEIKDKEVVYVTDGKEIETTKKYLFVIGDKEISVQVKKK